MEGLSLIAGLLFVVLMLSAYILYPVQIIRLERRLPMAEALPRATQS